MPLDPEIAPPFISSAGDIVSQMLQSTALSSSLNAAYHSQRNNNGADALKKEIEELGSVDAFTNEHAPLLYFMQELVKLQRDALGKNPSSEFNKQQKAELDSLAGYFSTLLPDLNLREAAWQQWNEERKNPNSWPQRNIPESVLGVTSAVGNAWNRFYHEPLPDGYQQILQAETRTTRQGSMKPLRSFAHGGGHILDEMKDMWRYPNPWVRWPLRTVVFPFTAYVAYMMAQTVNSSTTVANEETLGLMPWDVTPDGQIRDDFVPEKLDGPKCHDHLANGIEIVTVSLADGDYWAKKIKDAGVKVPEHCLVTLSEGLGAYAEVFEGEYWYEYGAGFAGKKIKELIGTPSGPFTKGAYQAVDPVNKTILKVEYGENSIVHGPMPGMGAVFVMALLLRAIKKAQGKFAPIDGHILDEKDSAVDFLHRFLVDRPLGWAFAAVGGGGTYYLSDDIKMAVWATVFSGAAGFLTQLTRDIFQRKNHVSNMTENSSNLLRQFKGAARHKPLSEIPLPKEIPYVKITAGALSLAAYVTSVLNSRGDDLLYAMKLVAGEFGTGTALAIWYALTNVVQDSISHVALLGLGAVPPTAILLPVLAYYLAKPPIVCASNVIKEKYQQMSQKFQSSFKTAVKATVITLSLTFSSSAIAPKVDDQTPIEIHIPLEPDVDLSTLIKDNAFKLPSFPQDMVFS